MMVMSRLRRRQLQLMALQGSFVLFMFYIMSGPYSSNEDRFLRLESNDGDIGMIHLGKCGGMTLERTFALQPKIDSKIAQRHGDRYHINKPVLEKYKTWIAVIRDPVDRIKTSWIFEHVDNYPFKKDARPHAFKYKLFECYDTLDDLLTKGPYSETPSATKDDICPLLARQTFEEPLHNIKEGYGMYHFQFNFSYYFSDLIKVADEKDIYVIRSERMLHDLNEIERELGSPSGNQTFTELTPWNHYRVDSQWQLPKHDRTLSSEGLRILCGILCEEIQIYKQLFRAAKNLNIDDWIETSHQLFAKCPVEAQSSSCPPRERMSLEDKKRVFDLYFQRWGYPPDFDYEVNGKKKKAKKAIK